SSFTERHRESVNARRPTSQPGIGWITFYTPAGRTRGDGGVPTGVPPPGGDRGDDLAGCASLWPSAITICRGGQSSSAARRNRDGDQRIPDHRLVGGSPTRGDENVRLHAVDGHREGGVRNSPAVSKVRESQSQGRTSDRHGRGSEGR